MTATYTPSAPGDAEDRQSSPDLMSLDHKLDAVFGKQDAAEESLLLECVAYYDRIRGAR